MTVRVGIFYHCDPVGNVPSGIDSFIRGILQWAPPQLEYTLFGASSDTSQRPVGQAATVMVGGRQVTYLPIISIDASARRSLVPHTVKYLLALSRMRRSRQIADLDVLDFHRIEPGLLFGRDARPQNVTLHQDMSVIRERNSDIRWRYWPWAYESMERRLFPRLRRISCVRESAVQRYARLYPDLAERFRFIPTWVDQSTFRPQLDKLQGVNGGNELRRRVGASVGAKLMVFVGRLDKQKDPLLLLSSFARAQATAGDLHLVVVGDGALRESLESAVRASAMQNQVSLLGALGRDDIATILRHADMFVMSSAYEGMPIAVLEALACGLPVVSTDVGELHRVIRNGVNGFLCADHTAESLGAAVLAARDRLPEMRGQPCVVSAEPYHAERVLTGIYEHHLLQGRKGGGGRS